MGTDQRSEPAAEAAIRLAGCGPACAAVQSRAEQRIAERSGGDEVDQCIGIVSGDHRARGEAAMRR